MSDHSSATRLITAAAKQRLRPLGFAQHQRSRLWYQDRDWWLLLIDFSQSRRAGTYLHVAAMWLWIDNEHWSFDEGSRLHWRSDGSFTPAVPLGETGWTQFLEFRTAAQFTADLGQLTEMAATRAQELRELFANPSKAAEHLTTRATRRDESSVWHAYHSGAAAALSGDNATAQQCFDSIKVTNLDPEWAHDLAQQASTLSNLANEGTSLRQHLDEMIALSRDRHGLSTLPTPTSASAVGPN